MALLYSNEFNIFMLLTILEQCRMDIDTSLGINATLAII